MYAGPPTSSSSPERFSSSLSVTRSIASPRSASFTILSKMRRCASRKKSWASMTSAARVKASLWSRIAPRTERSASRLCGSGRSVVATSGIHQEKSAECTKKFGVWALPKLRIDCNRVLLLFRAFGDDAYLDGGGHVAVQLHRHFELAELLDRLLELQPAFVEIEALGGEHFGDVAGGHRP